MSRSGVGSRAMRGPSGMTIPPGAARWLGMGVAGLGVAAVVVGVVTGSWVTVTVGVLAAVLGVATRFVDLPLAAALATTVALPVTGVPWLADLAPSLGVFTVLLAVLGAAAAVRAVSEPQAVSAAVRQLVRTPLAWALAAFVGSAMLSLLVASRSGVSLQIARGYVGEAVLLPVLLTVVMAGRRSGPAAAALLASCLVLIAAFGSVLAIVQIATEYAYVAPGDELFAFVGERATGLSEHPGTWSAFGLVAMALAGATWVRLGDARAAGLLVLITAGVLLTSARAAWLAVAACCVLVLAAPGVAVLRRVGVVGLVLAGFGVALAVWNADALPVLKSLQEQGPGGAGRGPDGPGRGAKARGAQRIAVDESASSRITITRAELELGARHPLSGVGLGKIGPAMIEERLPYIVGKTRQEVGFTPGEPIDKHNAYAGLFAELGVLGLLGFLAVLGTGAAVLLGVRRRVSDDRLALALTDGLLAGLVGTAVIAAFTDADRLPFLWWILGMTLALGVTTGRRRPRTA